MNIFKALWEWFRNLVRTKAEDYKEIKGIERQAYRKVMLKRAEIEGIEKAQRRIQVKSKPPRRWI